MAEPMATLSRRERDWFSQPWAQQVLVEDVEEGVRASIEGYLEDGLSAVRPFEVDVTTVRAPVRAVHGSTDDWEPLASLRRVLVGLADAQLFVLDGLNHFGPLLRTCCLAVGTADRQASRSGCTIQTLGSQYVQRSAPRSTCSGASPSGKTKSPSAGSGRPVHDSHSATVPVMSSDSGSGA